MPLSQLQGLQPLGGSSNYGTGQPPNADGSDPNATNQQQPRRPRNTGAPSSSQGAPQQPGTAPTFAQLQQQGRARPAPPPAPPPAAPQGAPNLQSQTNQAASQALQNPSAYGAPQVQQSIDALNQNLAVQDTLGKQSIDQTMASRGLYDSTEAGRQYGLLAQGESAQRANLAAQLSTQAAQTYGQDRSTAIQNALGAQGQQFNQGLSQQQLQLQQALGYGNLGVQQGQLTGNYGGQSTLGAQQLAQQGSQFNANLGLQAGLGYGNLNLAQLQNSQQFGLSQGQLTGSYNGQQTLAGLQNQQQFGLNQQNLAQQQAYQSGQLGLGQQQINASLTNEQRSQIGNLLYAALNNGASLTDPQIQSWMNSLYGSQGQSNGSLYNLPSYTPYGGSPNSLGTLGPQTNPYVPASQFNPGGNQPTNSPNNNSLMSTPQFNFGGSSAPTSQGMPTSQGAGAMPVSGGQFQPSTGSFAMPGSGPQFLGGNMSAGQGMQGMPGMPSQAPSGVSAALGYGNQSSLMGAPSNAQQPQSAPMSMAQNASVGAAAGANDPSNQEGTPGQYASSYQPSNPYQPGDPNYDRYNNNPYPPGSAASAWYTNSAGKSDQLATFQGLQPGANGQLTDPKTGTSWNPDLVKALTTIDQAGSQPFSQDASNNWNQTVDQAFNANGFKTDGNGTTVAQQQPMTQPTPAGPSRYLNNGRLVDASGRPLSPDVLKALGYA